MTNKQKQTELLNAVSNFVCRAIELIDSKIKKDRPQQIEYEYIDLIAEAFFSVKSFCVLMSQGLISTATAVVRIALEQVSVITLIFSDEDIMKVFLEFRKERNTFCLNDKKFQNEYVRNIKNKYALKRVQIKQYFDYGWYQIDGEPVMNLEKICSAAGFSDAYEFVDSVVNSFSHGQISFYKLSRKRNGADKSFINKLFEILHSLLFKLIKVLCVKCDDFFGDNDIKAANMIYAISTNLLSMAFEKETIDSINNHLLKIRSIKSNSNSLKILLHKCEITNDSRELFLLSQAYIRYYKQLLSSALSLVFVFKRDYKLQSINLKSVVEICTIEESVLLEYKAKATIELLQMLDFYDSRNNDWSLSNDDFEYIVSGQILLDLLLERLEKQYDQ